MTRTLREHLEIYKILSYAVVCEVVIMGITISTSSASKIFVVIFLIATAGLISTLIGTSAYKYYLKKKFGKLARRYFLPDERKAMEYSRNNQSNYRSNLDSFENNTTSFITNSNLPGGIYHSDRFSHNHN